VSEWKIEFFKFPNDNSPVLDWFQSQEPKVKAKLARIFDLLEGEGISVGKPYVAPLEDKLYEIRIEQDTNIYRILYFAYTDKRFILLHGFQKKTQKTPKKELDLSKERMKAFLANEKAKQPLKNKDQTQKKGKKQ
jgi:phage-related protein